MTQENIKPNNSVPTMSKKEKEEEAKRKRIEFQESMKKERNYRGILCNTSESFGAIDLLRHGDTVVKTLRAGVYNTIDPVKADPLFKSYNDALIFLETVINKIGQVTGHEKYKCPRYITIIKEKHVLSEEAQILVDRINAIVVADDEKKAVNE